MKKISALVLFILLLAAPMLSAARKVGYYTSKKKVSFLFYPRGIKTKIKTVNVAGSFNGWKPTLRWWKMWHYKKGKCWILSMPKRVIKKGKRGKSGKYEFKFVVNGTQWVMPPKWTPNKAEDGYGGRNLIILDKDLK